jgi:hypothetical protein
VHRARAEARAEAEAAAEQRLAAALALGHADFDKQVRLTLFVRQCGSYAPALACFCRVCMRQTVLETAAHAMQAWQLGACNSGAQPVRNQPRLPNARLIEQPCPGGPSARRGARGRGSG